MDEMTQNASPVQHKNETKVRKIFYNYSINNVSNAVMSFSSQNLSESNRQQKPNPTLLRWKASSDRLKYEIKRQVL